MGTIEVRDGLYELRYTNLKTTRNDKPEKTMKMKLKLEPLQMEQVTVTYIRSIAP